MPDQSYNSGSPAVAERASQTSSSLLKRVQEHDAESWRRIVRLYAPLVLWWCRQRGLRDQDSQDVIQEVFKTIFVKIKTFVKDGQSGAFRRWLYSITRFKVREALRRINNEPPACGGSSAPARLDEMHAEDTDRDEDSEPCSDPRILLLHRALELLRNKFEPRTWEIVQRVVIEERYPQDVAEEFGISVGAVHKAKSVVLRCLRETLLEYEEFLN